MKLLLASAALAAAMALTAGCMPPGYYHTHPCECPDGQVRTFRHWHADTGYAGFHTHPFPNRIHKDLMLTGGMKEMKKRVAEEGE